jgi:hypothetical protein
MKMLPRLLNQHWTYLILAALLVANTACKKEEKKNEVRFNNIELNGAKEVPAVSTTATGTMGAIYDKDTKRLSYTIVFSNINPTVAHFHKGEEGVSGPPVITIPGPYTSPLSGTTDVLTSDQEADLLAGKWYVNLHSNANPGGEIRGQLKAN